MKDNSLLKKDSSKELMSGFLAKNKIDVIYSYKEVEVEKNIIHFGWEIVDSIDINSDIVVSYHSKTKKVTEKEYEWSKREGNSATKLSDYKLYFKSLTGYEPESFLDKYKDHKDLWIEDWASSNENSDDKTALFLFELSKLIVDGKKFIMYGRGFKLIKNSS